MSWGRVGFDWDPRAKSSICHETEIIWTRDAASLNLCGFHFWTRFKNCSTDLRDLSLVWNLVLDNGRESAVWTAALQLSRLSYSQTELQNWKSRLTRKSWGFVAVSTERWIAERRTLPCHVSGRWCWDRGEPDDKPRAGGGRDEPVWWVRGYLCQVGCQMVALAPKLLCTWKIFSDLLSEESQNSSLIHLCVSFI